MADTMQMFGVFCFPACVFYKCNHIVLLYYNNALLHKRVINDWFAIVLYFTMWFWPCFNLNAGFITKGFVLHPSKIGFTQ